MEVPLASNRLARGATLRHARKEAGLRKELLEFLGQPRRAGGCSGEGSPQ